MAESVTLRGVSCAYGSKQVLSGLSLSLSMPGAYAVLGPSGRGKTTLLRVIAGLTPLQAGSVTLPRGARIAFCFQEDRLLPFKTVLENVTLACDDPSAARQWVARVGLAGEENAYPDSLSGGMKRRAALARALALDAEILLMDEPFRALDEATHAAMLALVREAAKGKLLILVTHDESDAQDMQKILL